MIDAVVYLVLVSLLLSAGALAAIYEEPRVAGIAMVLAPCFLVVGLGLQHQALLRRRLHFGRLAVVEDEV